MKKEKIIPSVLLDKAGNELSIGDWVVPCAKNCYWAGEICRISDINLKAGKISLVFPKDYEASLGTVSLYDRDVEDYKEPIEKSGGYLEYVESSGHLRKWFDNGLGGEFKTAQEVYEYRKSRMYKPYSWNMKSISVVKIYGLNE